MSLTTTTSCIGAQTSISHVFTTVEICHSGPEVVKPGPFNSQPLEPCLVHVKTFHRLVFSKFVY